MERDAKKRILGFLFKEKILVSPDFVSALDEKSLTDRHVEKIQSFIKEKNVMVANKKILEGILSTIEPEDGGEAPVKIDGSVKIISSYDEESKKRSISDFVAFFNARYNTLKRMLMYRPELKNTVSINRLQHKKDRETVSVIGMIHSIDTTSNGNIMLTLEDPTGTVKVLVNKNNEKLFQKTKDLVLDEVIGAVGMSGDNIIFSNNIVFPEIPISNEFKKGPEEAYMVLLSDIHVGSHMFMKDKFEQFIKWIRGEVGSEDQRAIAKKIRYVVVVGDLVDGVGIYPNQNDELYADDIYEQYKECKELFQKIPSNIQIIISAGNHDAVRIAEPQPSLDKDFASYLWELPNVTMVSNPAVVNIEGTDKFPGFNLLLYHGYSFDYYVANVESIRNNGGYHNIENLMKLLLQKRHLAPTHTSSLYIPDKKTDSMVIEKVPDFFLTGHVHSSPKIENYKGITLVSCGCWQSITPFQEKVGHTPDPAKIPLINLQTREARILKF